MTAANGGVQHDVRLAIPFAQRAGDEANVVQIAVNPQWPFRSKNVANDCDFGGAYGPRNETSEKRGHDEAQNSADTKPPLGADPTQQFAGT
jgi:hypothetical protein